MQRLQGQYPGPTNAYEGEWRAGGRGATNGGGPAEDPRRKYQIYERPGAMAYCWQLVDHARKDGLDLVCDGNKRLGRGFSDPNAYFGAAFGIFFLLWL